MYMCPLSIKLSSVLKLLVLTTKIPVRIKTLILTGISVVSIKSFQTLEWMKTLNAYYKVVICKLVSKLNFKTVFSNGIRNKTQKN
jgi:hypothetical protein